VLRKIPHEALCECGARPAALQLFEKVYTKNGESDRVYATLCNDCLIFHASKRTDDFINDIVLHQHAMNAIASDAN